MSMNSEERVERRRQVLADYRSSGMTQKAFCREHYRAVESEEVADAWLAP